MTFDSDQNVYALYARTNSEYEVLRYDPLHQDLEKKPTHNEMLRTHLLAAADDSLWIIYSDAANDVNTLQQVEYGRPWEKRTVLSPGENLFHLDADFDSAGRLNVVYSTAAQNIWHAVEAIPVWTTSNVAQQGVRLAMGSDNSRRVLVYHNSGSGEIRHARFVTGSWYSSLIAALGAPGGYSWVDISVKPASEQYVVYYDHHQQAPVFAHGDVGAWSVESIVAPGSVGTGQSIHIAVDNQEHAHVIFRSDDAACGVVYAYK